MDNSEIDIANTVLLTLGAVVELILFFWLCMVYCGCTIRKYAKDSPQSPRSVTEREMQSKGAAVSDSKIQIDSASDHEQHIYNYTKSNMRKIPLVFKIWTLLSLFFGSVTIISVCCNHLLRILHIYEGSCLSDNVPVIAFLFQRLTLYTYFIHRIEITFKDSAYSLNKRKLNMFKTIIYVFGVSMIIFYFIFIEMQQCTAISLLIGFIPAAINDTFVSISTLILFTSRLKKLMRMDSSKDNPASNAKLKYIITKLTILVFVSVFSTIFLMALFVIVPVIGIIAIDIVINSLCLLLSYVYFSKYYEILCCFCRRICGDMRRQ